jgi:hypothetical protein
MSKLTSILFLLLSGICFSQTKLIHGKVSYQDSYQKNIDVINYTTKKITKTNTLGEFNIEAKVNDILVFMSENFSDQKYYIKQDDFEKGYLTVRLVEKPVPLDEVEIRQVKAIKLESTTYNGIKMAELEKQQSNPVNKDIYTGEIPMGMDFVQIGKMVGKLFKSKDQKDRKVVETMTFTDYAKANFNQSFFSKTLKLKPSQTTRFLEYCEADPQSKTVIGKNDELAMLEFLLVKKGEFEKLK